MNIFSYVFFAALLAPSFLVAFSSFQKTGYCELKAVDGRLKTPNSSLIELESHLEKLHSTLQ